MSKIKSKTVLKILLYSTLALGLFVHCIIVLSKYHYLYKALWATYLSGKTGPDIYDEKYFDKALVATAKSTQAWPKHAKYNQYQLSDSLEALLKLGQNHALLVVHQGELLFEQYAQGVSADSRTNSFSMAKSVISMMTERARLLGHLTSFEEPLGDFLENYQTQERKDKDFKHFLDMSSGLVWNESHRNPFADNARAYYTDDLQYVATDAAFDRAAGKIFNYQSGSTQIASIALQKALHKAQYTGGLHDFLSQEFWQPLGMQDSTFWGLDKKAGIEKAYCCLYSTAQNFAKLGQLILNRGLWQGQRLLSEAYIERISSPNSALWDEERKKINERYSLGFWHSEYEGRKIIYFAGSLGQYILVLPEEELVIVRTGNKKIMPLMLPKKDEHDVHFYVDLGLKIVQATH